VTLPLQTRPTSPGAGTDQPVAYVEGASGVAQRYYYHSDRQGSIIAMANASGARVERYRYAPYGVESDLVLTGQPYRYTGRRFDPETGLFHYRARMYAPGLGRFLETDPVGYADQMNLYAYVGNDPLNATDPTGRVLDTIVDVGFIAFDIYKIATEGATPENVTALGADALGALVPGLTGAGMATRVATHADDAADVARGLSNASDAARSTCCFVEGTLVETTDGLRPIEEIEVGDLVLSRNEITGDTAYKPVTQRVFRHERQVWRLTFALPGGTQTFGATDDHPWRTVDGRWLQTSDLDVGILILRADGEPARLVSIVRTGEVAETYNLEVADFHTYFVGEARVWVHNACPNPNGSRGSAEHQAGVAEQRADFEGQAADLTERTGVPHVVPPSGTRIRGHDSRRMPDNQIQRENADGSRTTVRVGEVDTRPDSPRARERREEYQDQEIPCDQRSCRRRQ